ncbi:hypothetical protein [Salipiger abyssi]|uniref:hypothetical protein n=1 Tax=Salipiger abyssi TaxID=1250539 RepID=UPI001A8D4BC0|nr:hypothetical protein [Salipiger abyssi]MBN9886769.1 hypothetical protein [Salipiger abyssi]
MVSSSKILTVSYGTFSCTAEGFEDPLGVVKETTHFFRGVIREDRFFGAEPPQFDPDMAAELLQSQLKSEMGEGSLTLRSPFSSGGAASAGALSAALAAGPSALRPAAAAPAMDEPEVPVAEAPVAAAADLAEESVAADTGPALEDSISAVLADAEQVQEAAEPAEDDSVEEVAEAEPAYQTSQPAADELSQAEGFEAEGEDSLEAEAEFFEAGPAERERAEAPAPLNDPESVAAKLRRIRAVVAGGAPEAQTADAVTLDDAEEEADAPAVSAMLGALTAEDAEPRATADADRDNLFTDTLAGLDFDETYDEDEDADEPLSKDAVRVAAAAVAQNEPEEATPPRRPRARVVKVKRAAFDSALADGLIEEVAEQSPQGADTVSSLSAEDEDDLARELAAVKAELKADIDAAWDAPEDDIDADDLSVETNEEETEDHGFDDWGDGDEKDILSAVSASISERDEAFEDEGDAEGLPDAEPLRLRKQDSADEDWAEEDAAFAKNIESEFDEVFEPEADDAEPSEAAPDVDDEVIEQLARKGARKAVKMSSPARAMLTENSVGDTDASRILDETNTQLEEPEGNRRRSAIAHLRAAVAATRADKLLGRKKDSEAAFEPYREDLANVVRPRRPHAPENHTQRPVELTRPAPLKLVAEQRVDAEQPAPRPRRVHVAEVETGGESGFADYADSVGAVDLPDLLEAAAAYLSFVEGREQFSRPQLMTKVRQVETHESSREDRLRTFGQLLREGKIEKTRGGRFTASERISFKPDARAAG